MLQNTRQWSNKGLLPTNFKIRLPTADKYQTKNIQDLYDKGFRNVRLRCRPDLYEDQYDTAEFNVFLTKLAEVGLMFAKEV